MESGWVTERFLGAGIRLRTALLELEEALDYWRYYETGVEWEVVCDAGFGEVVRGALERAKAELGRERGQSGHVARLWGSYLVGVGLGRAGDFAESGRQLLAARTIVGGGRAYQAIRTLVERAAAALRIAQGDYAGAYEMSRAIERRVVLIGNTERVLEGGVRAGSTISLEFESGVLSGSFLSASGIEGKSLVNEGNTRGTALGWLKQLQSAAADGWFKGVLTVAESLLGGGELTEVLERELIDEGVLAGQAASLIGLLVGGSGVAVGVSESLLKRIEHMYRVLTGQGFYRARVERYRLIGERLGTLRGSLTVDSGSLAGALQVVTEAGRSAGEVNAEVVEGITESVVGEIVGENTGGVRGIIGGVTKEDAEGITGGVIAREIAEGITEGITGEALEKDVSEAVGGSLWGGRKRSDWEWEMGYWGWHATSELIGHEGVSGRLEIAVERGVGGAALLGWVEFAQGGYWEAHVDRAEWQAVMGAMRSADGTVGVVGDSTRGGSVEDRPHTNGGERAVEVAGEGVLREDEEGECFGVEALWRLYESVQEVYRRRRLQGLEGAAGEIFAGFGLRGRFYRCGLFDLSVEGRLGGVRATTLDFELARLYDEVRAGVKAEVEALGEIERVLNQARGGAEDSSGASGAEGTDDFDWEAFERAFNPPVNTAVATTPSVSDAVAVTADLGADLATATIEPAIKTGLETEIESTIKSEGLGSEIESGIKSATESATKPTGILANKIPARSTTETTPKLTPVIGTEKRTEEAIALAREQAGVDELGGEAAGAGARSEAVIDEGRDAARIAREGIKRHARGVGSGAERAVDWLSEISEALTRVGIKDIAEWLSERYCTGLQVFIRTRSGYRLIYQRGRGVIGCAIGDELTSEQYIDAHGERGADGRADGVIGYELGIGYALSYRARAVEVVDLVRLVFRAWEWSHGTAVVSGNYSGTEGFVYGDEATERLLWRVQRLAEHDGLEGRPLAHVLLIGARGVGKELIAKLIHQWSGRREKPYIVCNGAVLGLNATLATAEFFGAEPGAYTDAPRQGRRGLVEQAADGTLFIDEVNELTPEVTGLLKRVVQEGDYTRLGSTQRRAARCRFILATNRPDRLPEDVRDRFYQLEIPPLAARPGDIGPLARHFAAHYGCAIDAKLIEFLEGQEWPGNVRELERLIYELAAFAPQDGGTGTSTPYVLSLRDLEAVRGLRGADKVARTPESRRGGGAEVAEGAEVLENVLSKGGVGKDLELAKQLLAWGGKDLSGATERFRRMMIEAALLLEDGNRTRAARRLGITRQGLRKYLERIEAD